ncbi:DEAD/DEAH box helicase [Dictyocaulus viviparus]|uniref:RNA helicase n=1 Tax=Dictyocaulus viviparus TaxID=29172 RepID=A0A0D8Y0D6_DICVI|nr:DEAD/DEAH box helicase [Dictyocaulus viviparus]
MEFREVIEVDDINYRTNDVKTQGSFESLMISPSTVTNLRNHGYRIPSPVQMKAIPTGLTGFDMLVQAKSGTGKTLVFSVLAVENLNLQSNDVQRMVVAPTREIAIQIKDTIKKIAHFKTRVILLVGGTPVHLDVQALKRGGHIVVGTTGRICQMAQNGNLDMNCIDLFVLDEADKLMEECFQKDINYLFSALPPTRQVVVFSATYPKNLDLLLMKFMRDPSLVRLNSDDVQLVGIKQYVITTDEASLDILVRLLKSVHFNQTLVFCNLHQQCERTTVHLESVGFNSAYISAQLTQPQRDAVVEKLKQNKIKVLVSTDLTARGIDAASVNLVVNLGSAINVETYLHRIGRAARFGMLWKYSSGGYGAAVTILSDSREISRFKAIAREGGINVRNLDLEVLPPDLTVNQSFFDLCSHFGTIQENCAKSKYSTHKSVQECSVSKITNEDININQKSLDRNPASACYDRQTLLSISRYPIILSEKMQKQICDIGIVRCENPNISSLDKKGHVLEMRSGETIPESPSTDCIREPIKKSTTTDLKFIPFCEKTRRLFYMRGDLIRILESIDKESWKQYASSK